MTVPVRHESGPAHRRLIANALNAISVLFNGLPTSAAGDSMVSDGDGTVTWGRPSGSVVQQVNTQTGATASGTTTIPFDDTVPQITEGTEFMTCSITPKNVANKLRIDVLAHVGTSIANAYKIVALFQDTTASALSVTTGHYNQAATGVNCINFTYWMDAGTISSTTFRVRGGPNAAATMYFNGDVTAKFGGALISSITITEYAA